jgi:hypothetical protein
MEEEGLFRISGRSSHVAKLRQIFDAGADIDLTQADPGDLDPHAVSSMLKAYLRELPDPILTRQLSTKFTEVMDSALAGSSSNANLNAWSPSDEHSPTFNTNEGCKAIPALVDLVSQLPVENRDLLREISRLLDLTASHHKRTKMPLSNLLLVFCPSLGLHPTLLKVFVEHWKEIFGCKEESSVEEKAEEKPIILVVEPAKGKKVEEKVSRKVPQKIVEEEVPKKPSKIDSKPPRLPNLRPVSTFAIKGAIRYSTQDIPLVPALPPATSTSATTIISTSSAPETNLSVPGTRQRSATLPNPSSSDPVLGASTTAAADQPSPAGATPGSSRPKTDKITTNLTPVNEDKPLSNETSRTPIALMFMKTRPSDSNLPSASSTFSPSLYLNIPPSQQPALSPVQISAGTSSLSPIPPSKVLSPPPRIAVNGIASPTGPNHHTDMDDWTRSVLAAAGAESPHPNVKEAVAIFEGRNV